MKILYVITTGKLGGAQRYVAALANDQKRRGNEVRVLAGEEGTWLEKQLNMTLERVPLKRSWNLRQGAYKKALRDVLVEFQPDVVHFHSSHAMLGLRVVKEFPAIRSVITIHGLSLYRQRGMGSCLYRSFLRKAVGLADHVSFVCKADRQVLLDEGRLHNNVTSVVYPGIDAPTLLPREDARDRLGLGSKDVVIAMIGRFSKQKNQRLLVDAFAQMQNPNVRLVLVGTGNKPEVSDDRIILTEGGPELLSAFDVFVNTSLYEGFPYVLLEAGSTEVPVVVTNVGGVSELIEDGVTGYLVDMNPESVVEGIERALEVPDVKGVLKDRVESLFTTERLTQGMHDVYEKTA